MKGSISFDSTNNLMFDILIIRIMVILKVIQEITLFRDSITNNKIQFLLIRKCVTYNNKHYETIILNILYL